MTFNLPFVRSRLPSHRVEWFPSIDSTMMVASQLARKGHGQGAIVVADEQTAGMGRQGRSWHSPAGEGLYVSLVLAAKPAPILMLALGLATQEVIREALAMVARPPLVDIRWPNDILLQPEHDVEYKCAGILAQVERDSVIAGIGINVSQQHFPPDLDTPGISLALAGVDMRREELLVELVESIDYYAGLSTAQVTAKFLESSSYAHGKRVQTEAGGRKIEGVTNGLDPSGFLRIKLDDGTERTILAGGVRPV
ncbi:MAG: biotin--[acetyl-CoA-carboxylase] ligase [Acidobacteriota bacterium]